MPEGEGDSKRRRRRPMLDRDGGIMPWMQGGIGAGALLAFLAIVFLPSAGEMALKMLQQYTGDKRTSWLSTQPATQHDRIVLVTITDETLRNFASSPIDRGLLAQIVKAVDAGRPTAIGLDVYFLKPTEEAKDTALVEALRAAKSEVVLGAWDERGGLEGFQQEFQDKFLQRIGRKVGYLNLRSDKDQVVRTTAGPSPDGNYPQSFASLLAAAAGVTAADRREPISWLLPPADGKPDFLKITAHKLIEGGAQAAKPLEGKIVMVGGEFPNRDRHRIPLTIDEGEDVPGLFIQAQILAAKLAPARTIRELDVVQGRILLMVLAIVGFLIGWRIWDSPVVNMIGWTFATFALMAADAALFRYGHLLLPYTLALLAWCLGVTAGRFIRGFGVFILDRRDAT